MAKILLGSPGVTEPSDEARAKRSFGSNGLRINNKIFVMLVRDHLVVKLPRQSVDALIVSGDGEQFDPGHGRLMKEWLVLNPTSRQEWLPLAQKAMKFVASQR
jgi:TfoX/Sxy family transcriptional regulator of competence genes